jgi:membrane glycosyltransferase
MDAVSRLPHTSAPSADSLPPEAPLAMPQQSLWQAPKSATSPATSPPLIVLRRVLVFGASIVLTTLASYQMYEVLQVGGLTVLETIILVLFVMMFAWIALSFVSALAGFCSVLIGRRRTLGIDPAAALPRLQTRSALLLPTYNEDPNRVMARLQAIYESVRETGRLAHFDSFILSDTTDPAIWVAEEACFLRLRNRGCNERLYYRHRASNVGRKAGNIADWVMCFGGAYNHMIVLDADSLMDGRTIVRLAAAMEQHPSVGLIQTLPMLVNANTLFARLQQFAGSLYGPLIAHGIAWWHGADSNYWGHNAIIRIEAFASQAGLPLLKGRKPFGGHILSHDFVEAALMRRAGWGIHMAPELDGSYEECPPTLTDYIARDRRWCQGNLQHAGVLPARGLYWLSRLHLLVGIGGYLTAPMWLIFLLIGILIALQARFIPPDYFPAHPTLFPQWPMQDPVRAAYVFLGTMSLLIVPKLLGWVAMMPRRRNRGGMGGGAHGLASVLLEIVVSALIAPVMMLAQCRAVGQILRGRDAGWSAQTREHAGSMRLSDFARDYLWPTTLGILLALAAVAVSAPLLYWMSPVIAGLALAVPLAGVSAKVSAGALLRRASLLLTPYECVPPAILSRANAIAENDRVTAAANPIATLLADPELRAAHLGMLSPPAPRAPGDIDVTLIVALAKLDQSQSAKQAIGLLSQQETLAVLSNPPALRRLLRLT